MRLLQDPHELLLRHVALDHPLILQIAPGPGLAARPAAIVVSVIV